LEELFCTLPEVYQADLFLDPVERAAMVAKNKSRSLTMSAGVVYCFEDSYNIPALEKTVNFEFTRSSLDLRDRGIFQRALLSLGGSLPSNSSAG
jgi:hypothetical protein